VTTPPSARVLLGDADVAQRSAAQMALRGTGLEVDIVASVDEGLALLARGAPYQVVLVDHVMLPLAERAYQQNPSIRAVLTSSTSEAEYLPVLDRYPFISNIIARFGKKRLFTVKSLLPTVSKLISDDIFGLDKYLAWGAKTFEATVTSSADRAARMVELRAYLADIGVRSRIQRTAAFVAEEMIMNLLYDAPLDEQRRPRYNHLPRDQPINLLPTEHGVFRYGCDGYWIGIAAEDRFGGLQRSTVIDYLYGSRGASSSTSAGAGLGLFEINKLSEMLNFNVEVGVRTEVIALIPVETGTDNVCSLHYFTR
jgi:CheY-like chemotaxis protein